MTIDEELRSSSEIAWLLEGDPAVRYQVLRDVTDAPEDVVRRERERILREGWGAELLRRQDDEGTWSHALYSPKWTSTFYTLLLLKRFGACPTPQTEAACRVLLDHGFFPADGGVNYWKTWKQGECCVTGMLLSMLCHFEYADDRIDRMVEYLVAQQMPDRGWNCERYRGAVHGSFHTTISVLEGLWEYEKSYPAGPHVGEVRRAADEGIEFLLQHHLYRSSTTGLPVDVKMTKMAFPPRWYFDFLRCLDHFQDRNVATDPRMSDAVELLREKQTPEGRWKLELKHPAKVYFELERVGQESRWNTLRAMRVLRWWESR